MSPSLTNTEQSLSTTLAVPAAIASMESPLLRTKLHIPSPTAALLARPRLTDRIRPQTTGFITLLSAPAGFGKTTLVSDWIRRENLPAAWLTLDEHDNDPVLFWRYLCAALQTVDERLGLRTIASLAALTRVPLEMVVTYLINDIASHVPAEKPVILVLDNFHRIHNAAIHQTLTYLLQHQPPQLHLILVTRADPSLSLARMRVEGRLLELRAADLRLTKEEVIAFFDQVMALEVSAEIVSLLYEQTEGWAAGLQLAALSLRQRTSADAERLMHTAAGLKKHVFAYLMEEVLDQQSPEVRQFLQQTAVLQQFSAPLCTAVTGYQDAAALLRRLDAENLFIKPLDDDGQWYRYHPLFAEMLQTNLDEDSRRECRRRAANWYASQQLIQDALRNAQAAEDYSLMAGLLSQTYKTLLADALLVSLQKWLAAVPAAHQSPRLRLAAAWCRVYESSESEIDQIIHDIMAASPEIEDSFRGEMLAVRAVYASLYGEPDEAVKFAVQGLALIEPGDYLSLAAAYQALGNAYRYRGELEAAYAAYSQGHRHFENMGNVFMSQLPLNRMAGVRIMQGRLHQALQTYEAARLQAQTAGYEPLIMAGEVFGYLSDLYLEWNDLEKAAAYAQQEIDLAQSGNMLLGLVDGYLKLSAVHLANGDEAAARETLRLAATAAVPLESAPVAAHIAMIQAGCELALGNLSLAGAWADDYERRRGTDECELAPLLAQSADLLLARIRLAQGRPQAALDFLQEVTSRLEAIGRIRLVVEAAILRALALAGQKQNDAAQQALIQALALAQPEGYMRVFVENGRILTTLLSQVRHVFPHYVSQILAAFPTALVANEPEPILLDPLTEREREILRLIAQGHSNRQIADGLFISVGTVKGHVNHIFSKLDVKNRTQALILARELNLTDV